MRSFRRQFENVEPAKKAPDIRDRPRAEADPTKRGIALCDQIPSKFVLARVFDAREERNAGFATVLHSYQKTRCPNLEGKGPQILF
ncbi:MAG: hypothetical protein WDN46_03180 [Methylocella sp.]